MTTKEKNLQVIEGLLSGERKSTVTYVVLARKWRPNQFSEVVGQEPIAKTLENAIRLQRVPHALLFTGSRGVGKTSMARILAKALNCETGPTLQPCDQCSNCKEISLGSNVDVREIDGASATSVDDVRELRENVRYTPSKSKHKIFIIDEVHMLSTSAFNALLKTIEEPPPGVVFIFATTEPHKIPDTILSRCQRFDFRQISDQQITAHLKKIVQQEKILIHESALPMISRQGSGSLRDALSLLDQVIAFSSGDPNREISEDEVSSVLGLTDRSCILRTLEAFLEHDAQKALKVLAEVWDRGFDLKNYMVEVCERIRDLLVLKSGGDPSLVRTHQIEKEFFEKSILNVSELELERWFDLLRFSIGDINRSEFPRFVAEVAFLRVTRNEQHLPADEILNRLEGLEKKLGTVSFSKASAGPSSAKDLSKKEEIKPKAPSQNLSSPPQWDPLVEAVKRQKPAFAAILLQVSKVSFEGQTLVLVFEEGSFYVSRANEADFRSFLAQAASSLFGGEFLIQVQTQPKLSNSSSSSKPLDREREKEALENPTVQRAVSLFQARIEEIKPVNK